MPRTGDTMHERQPEGFPPEALLSAFPEPMRVIAEGLREVVRTAVPDAVERVRPGWRLIGYDIPRGRRGSTYFCYIAPEREHVHLGFEYGVFMVDPDATLEGFGVTRQTRWVTLRQPGGVRDERLVRLVREGARVALLSPAQRIAQMPDGPAPLG